MAPVLSISQRRQSGFTLIEVLAAVTIIAFMVPALMLLMMQQTNSAGALRERTIALWVAENKATELRLQRTFLQQLLQRESTETITMADSEWTVDVDIEKTVINALVLYRIQVSRNSEAPVFTLELWLDET